MFPSLSKKPVYDVCRHDSLVSCAFFFQEELSDYGVDWLGPASASSDEVERVVVPTVSQYLSNTQVSYLLSLVDPLQECEDHGKSLYVITRQLVRELLT